MACSQGVEFERDTDAERACQIVELRNATRRCVLPGLVGARATIYVANGNATYDPLSLLNCYAPQCRHNLCIELAPRSAHELPDCFRR
jgi:hypothetical protein